MTSPVRRFAAVALAFAGACASPGLPAGGPISRKPLVLLKVTPDTNSLNVKARSVVFQFDKVVRETDKLNQLVTISPSDGPPSVDWSRYTLVVHPYKPWRANTAYTVTILPGLADLFGNSTTKPFQTVFSTGKEIPQGAVFGVAFDWAEYRVASGARIEAMVGSDTILRYVATSDSSGRFALRHLPAGDLRLRVFIDENKNGILDRREKWDSVSVSLTDSARHDFYAFSHDSAGPSLGEGTGVTDSLTVHVRFTQPLSPNVPFDTSNLRLRLLTKDSSLVAIRGVFVAVTHDSVETARKNFVADSMMRADTSAKGRAKVLAADSARAQALRFAQSQAQIANVRNRRDSAKKVPPPTLNRPKPVSDFVIELMQPLADSSRMMLTATGVSNIAGSTRTSSRPVSWFKPKVTKQDSTATKPPAARPRPPANP